MLGMRTGVLIGSRPALSSPWDGIKTWQLLFPWTSRRAAYVIILYLEKSRNRSITG
jgi:hypothetical protein